MRYDVKKIFKSNGKDEIETFSKYVIKDNKIIAYYIINGEQFYYDIFNYSKETHDNITYLMESQLETFISIEPYINQQLDELTNSINSIKEAVFGDIKTNLENVKKVKELEEIKEYIDLCKTYEENKEILNLESKDNPFQVVTVNDIDNYTKSELLEIIHQKNKKQKYDL